MENKKVSIIIPCYGTEKYVNRCIDSVLNQTYKELEIILVNDASPGDMEDILSKYKKLDKRIKVVTHEKNKGLFLARLSGAKQATGNYISFLDSDDYVDLDYYRELVFSLENSKADMVFSNTVREEDDKKFVYNLFKTGMTELSGKLILDEYFRQEGKNYRWHTIWNKLYSMKLWKKCENYYKKIKQHLIMTEDFAFSTVIFSNATKVVYNERANYFYCANDEASTSVEKIKYNKAKKSIDDIICSFDFVENYLKEKKLWRKYQQNFENWKLLYARVWHDNVDNSEMSTDEKEELFDLICEFDSDFSDEVEICDVNFYALTTEWNDKLLKLKEEIVNHDVISFDIFDTLVVRPFYEPVDLFRFLNREYMKLFESNGLLDFSTIRVDAERECRNIKYKEGIKEITLDDIYDFINERYELDKEKLEKLKKLEIELEIRFCTRRETAYSLYQLAKYLGKKVIIISDMYLSKDIIKKILDKNNYYFDDYFVSNEYNLAKYDGSLFDYIRENYEDYSDCVLHIGDNINSDVTMPREHGYDAGYFPRTVNTFMNYVGDENNVNYCGRVFENFESLNIDHGNYRDFLGNRCSMAVIANKFFDNPFVSFNSVSDFNCDAYFIGYYTLGMHILAIVKWLLDGVKKGKYDSLSFMARDGYVPYLAAKELIDLYDMRDLKLNYTYLSRKSLFPLNVTELKDLYKFREHFNMSTITVKKIIKVLHYILDLPDDYEKRLEDNGFKLEEILETSEDYYNFMKFIYDNFYSKKKYEEYVSIAKEYFEKEFEGKTATFDIGYSGQPELILTDLLKKPVDTYFIHVNSDSGFVKSNYANYELNCFYPFKPTFTGTLREYIISSIEQSCIGYKKENGKSVPIFENKEIYSYFDNKMLEELQTGCIEFVKEFRDIFQFYLFEMELNNYYMSIPYEYFLCYSKFNDRLIFNGLKFEQNVGEEVEVLDFWRGRFEEYNSYCNFYARNNSVVGYSYDYSRFLNERVAHRNILIRGLFYIVFDRVTLRNKLKDRLNKEGIVYKVLRKGYRFLKRK